MDDVKKEIRKEQIKAGFGNPIDDDGGDSSDSDEDKYVDKMDMPGRLFFLFLIASLSPRDLSNKYNQSHYIEFAQGSVSSRAIHN